jgi:hypothetical protein
VRIFDGDYNTSHLLLAADRSKESYRTDRSKMRRSTGMHLGVFEWTKMYRRVMYKKKKIDMETVNNTNANNNDNF